jgi:signal transduction histidine kinase
MIEKTGYQTLEQKVKFLEKELARLKRTDEALRKSEEYYSTLVENSLTGIYIDPTDHRKVFEKFHRLKGTEAEEGTGLGLAIAERMVKYHGGTIWVNSERERGATFYFSLPKKPREEVR